MKFTQLFKISILSVCLAVLTGCGFESAWPSGDTLPQEVVTFQYFFNEWQNKWADQGVEFKVLDFTKVSDGRIFVGKKEPLPDKTSEQLYDPHHIRRSYSLKGYKFIDYLFNNDEPEQVTEIYSRDLKGDWEVLNDCKTDCRYDEARWLDEDRFFVVGTDKVYDEQEMTKTDDEGNETTETQQVHRCNTEGKCAYRMLIDVYNLSANKRARYLSDEKWVSKNPYDDFNMVRYINSLTEYEKLIRDARLKKKAEEAKKN
jgi:hypothetical protein